MKDVRIICSVCHEVIRDIHDVPDDQVKLILPEIQTPCPHGHEKFELEIQESTTVPYDPVDDLFAEDDEDDEDLI